MFYEIMNNMRKSFKRGVFRKTTPSRTHNSISTHKKFRLVIVKKSINTTFYCLSPSCRHNEKDLTVFPPKLLGLKGLLNFVSSHDPLLI